MLNILGIWTLLKKEVWRFLKVYHQTILSPIVNIILFLAVFSLSVGDKIKTIEGLPFATFMGSGLIMMAAMQNSFANSSSSFVMSKVLGYFADYLLPPIGAFGLLLAFTLGAILRGICVAIVAFIAISFFVDFEIFSFSYLIFYLFFACMFLALLGVLCGVISETFDQMSAMTSYVITPLTFLSGTFYSTKALPEFWYNVSQYNPFFYMIDGFRYAMTGYHDGNLNIGIISIIFINLILALVLYNLIKKGYKITN
ncbi:MAG: multidrug ABC transporter permease [Rickettsiales bacterium]|jgi:ABC-2 type transport system permease protein|nr:multidrug ABC transporter permease [Rickettsiales bacterium]|tara:strand:+ start:16461 stop:17225 length:765 start_codon:yes stop_codon:yes gene_type:complete